jgi:anti-sigma B factor antagonist
MTEPKEPTNVDLSVSHIDDGRTTVVSVGGEVDVYTAGLLRNAIDEQIAAGARQIIVDLNETQFMDSTGLGVLVGRLKLVRHHHGWLRVACANERILRVFKITGLDTVFSIHDTVAEAAQSADEPPAAS